MNTLFSSPVVISSASDCTFGAEALCPPAIHCSGGYHPRQAGAQPAFCPCLLEQTTGFLTVIQLVREGYQMQSIADRERECSESCWLTFLCNFAVSVV